MALWAAAVAVLAADTVVVVAAAAGCVVDGVRTPDGLLDWVG